MAIRIARLPTFGRDGHGRRRAVRRTGRTDTDREVVDARTVAQSRLHHLQVELFDPSAGPYRGVRPQGRTHRLGDLSRQVWPDCRSRVEAIARALPPSAGH